MEEREIVSSHRESVAWQKGMQLAKAVYEVTKGFPPDERFGMTNQLRRAAVSALSNGPTRSGCLGQALSKDGNGVSLALDVAGDLAAFIPGGGLVATTSVALTRTALGVQAGLAVASTVHSVAVGSAPGAALGILGGQATGTAAAAEKLAVGFGKSIPVIGLFFNLGATAIDGIQTYQAYSACLSGHS